MKYIKIGDIKMTTRSSNGYLLTAAPDTSSGDVQANVINYAGCDGEEIKDIYFKSRSFSIEGYILSHSEQGYQLLRRKLIHELIPKKEYELEYYDGGDTYKAMVFIDGNVTFGRVVGRKNGSFLLNVTIPGFYFKSKKSVFTEVYQRRDLITGNFTLPTVFTERRSTTNVSNKGDVPAFPVFTLSCISVEENQISITNDTTNEKIILNYTPTVGEKIIIDCENFKIESSIKGNIIKYLSADSVFFLIGTGNVRLSCQTNGVGISVEFFERYSGV